jgi:Flp pilus assembly protein TadG
MIRKLIGSLRRRGEARNAGAAAVELAITAPILVALMLGVADYGQLVNSAASVVGATRAGAEVAKANPNVTAAQLTALNLFPSGVTPTVSPPFCTCVDNTSVSCPGPGAANPCGANADTRVLKYLTVSATRPFSPLVAWSSFTFPSSLNASTAVRLE